MKSYKTNALITLDSEHTRKFGNASEGLQAASAVLKFAQGVGWRRLAWFNSIALWLFATLYVLLGCTHGAPRPSVNPPGRTVHVQEAAALQIQVVCISGDPFGSGAMHYTAQGGSAVVVGPSAALTAAHVVTCPDHYAATLIIAENIVGDHIPVRVVKIDTVHDLAALHFDFPNSVGFVPVVAPHAGERVCFLPAMPGRARTCGTVSSTAPELMDSGATVDIHHDAITIPGNSGSGLYNEAGDLVGIVTHSRRCNTTSPDICGGLASSLYGKNMVQ